MYLRSVKITNIRSLKSLTWKIPSSAKLPGWHVLLGDNGSGKSTFVQAVALALVGPENAGALRQDWNDWLMRGETLGAISLQLEYDKQFDKFSASGKTPTSATLPLAIELNRQEENVRLTETKMDFDPERHTWGGRSGWFSASYGPFRRFTGGDKNYEKLFYTHPRLAAHLSVFGEDIALTESLGWLRQMHVDKLEGRSDGLFLNAIRSFINQPGFLPHNAQLKSITSRDVEFVDGNGCELSVENLSDGYRATLSMTFELIRQLANGYGIENLFDAEKRTVVTPGVVLVDEIDAHLHPNWQTRIGKWFEEYFGEIQFIVTTHSPIICWAAEGGGTVYKLPLPGSRKDGAMVEGIALLRLLYGDLLDAYGTDLFGQDVTRSEKAREKLQELADLNFKEKKGSLNKEEKARQYELRSVFSYE